MLVDTSSTKKASFTQSHRKKFGDPGAQESNMSAFPSDHVAFVAEWCLIRKISCYLRMNLPGRMVLLDDISRIFINFKHMEVN